MIRNERKNKTKQNLKRLYSELLDNEIQEEIMNLIIDGDKPEKIVQKLLKKFVDEIAND